MRIDPNINAREAQSAGPSSASSTREPAPSSASSALGGDTAQLSSDAVRVQSLAAQVNALPEVRQEKVAALRGAIRQGSYQVSPEQTAEAVLSELLARSAA